MYNEQTGKSSCQVEIGRSDDEEEAGPSRKVCAQKVVGKFPTNFKQHLKKYHAHQYEVVKLEAEAKEKKKADRRRKEREERRVTEGPGNTSAGFCRTICIQQNQ